MFYSCVLSSVTWTWIRRRSNVPSWLGNTAIVRKRCVIHTNSTCVCWRLSVATFTQKRKDASFDLWPPLGYLWSYYSKYRLSSTATWKSKATSGHITANTGCPAQLRETLRLPLVILQQIQAVQHSYVVILQQIQAVQHSYVVILQQIQAVQHSYVKE